MIFLLYWRSGKCNFRFPSTENVQGARWIAPPAGIIGYMLDALDF
jgi:hypothetical protein